MFTELTKQNLPEPNRLVVIKRQPNKIDSNPIYVGYRMNKPYEYSADLSKYSNWYGSKLKELGKCAFGEKKFDAMFADGSVISFCYLEDFIKEFINLKL